MISRQAVTAISPANLVPSTPVDLLAVAGLSASPFDLAAVEVDPVDDDVVGPALESEPDRRDLGLGLRQLGLEQLEDGAGLVAAGAGVQLVGEVRVSRSAGRGSDLGRDATAGGVDVDRGLRTCGASSLRGRRPSRRRTRRHYREDAPRRRCASRGAPNGPRSRSGQREVRPRRRARA
jgi:hypothetical protein